MGKIKAFLWKNKGYIAHYGLVGLTFLDPSVQVFLAAHKAGAAIGLAVWGHLLHWANGKLAAAGK